MAEGHTNNTGIKVFGYIAAMAALIGAMAAIVRPMQGQIDAQGEKLKSLAAEMNHDLDAHTENFKHRTMGSDIATVKQRFVEVETQFRGLRELVDARLEMTHEHIAAIEEWLSWWHKTVPGLDAQQNTRLEALERDLDKNGGR